MMDLWNGYKKEEFVYKDKKAIFIEPKKRIEGNKWMLKAEYWNAFPQIEIELLKRGFCLAFIENQTRWCAENDLVIKKEFADYIIEKYNLSKKFGIIGMSCGGLIGVNFTKKYPDMVSVIYLDAPVMNLLSCPAGIGNGTGELWEEFYSITGISLSELINYRQNPVDNMDILVSNNIPVILVCGDSDNLVPYEENGKQLYDYYIKNNGKIKLILKEGCGHHPHGLDDAHDVVEFIEDNY